MLSHERYIERIKPIYDTMKIAAMIAVVHLITQLGKTLFVTTAEVRKQTIILEQIRDNMPIMKGGR